MERLLWVVALVVLALLIFYGMRRGWTNRKHRQEQWVPAFPSVPQDRGAELLPATTGLYVGTTTAGDWQDRIVVGDIGHRADGVAMLTREGVLLERNGASPLWIPTESLLDVRVDSKLANKVVPGAGLLILTWQQDQHRFATGFRCDDKQLQRQWAETLQAEVAVPGAQEGTASIGREEQ